MLVSMYITSVRGVYDATKVYIYHTPPSIPGMIETVSVAHKIFYNKIRLQINKYRVYGSDAPGRINFNGTIYFTIN